MAGWVASPAIVNGAGGACKHSASKSRKFFEKGASVGKRPLLDQEIGTLLRSTLFGLAFANLRPGSQRLSASARRKPLNFEATRKGCYGPFPLSGRCRDKKTASQRKATSQSQAFGRALPPGEKTACRVRNRPPLAAVKF